MVPDIGAALSHQLWTSKLFVASKSVAGKRPDRPELKRQIQDIGRKAGKEGWDDDNAAPVSSLAVQQALKVADLLPTDIDDPEVASTPHGEIDFDWMNENREMLTLSIDANGAVAWATEINGSSCHGAFAEVSELPCPLECCLRQLHSWSLWPAKGTLTSDSICPVCGRRRQNHRERCQVKTL